MPFTPQLQKCLADIANDDYYLGSSQLPSRIEWHEFGFGKLTAIEAGSADAEGGPRVAAFRFAGVVQQNGCFLKPCGHWRGPGPFNQPFNKSKCNADIGPSNYPEFKDMWKACQEGVRRIQATADVRTGKYATPSGTKITKELLKDGMLTVRHENFVNQDPNSDNEQSAATAQEELNASYGTAWTTPEMPCISDAARHERDLIVASGLHAYNPLLAYNVVFPEAAATTKKASTPAGDKATEEGELPEEDVAEDEEPAVQLIEPGAVDRMLRGSLVDVRFSISRQYVQKRKQVLFLADIDEVYVLERRIEPE